MFAAASHIILYVNAGKEGQAGRQSYLATAHDKSTGRRPAFSFTRGKGFGAKKKLVARILKSEPLILKYKAHIFSYCLFSVNFSVAGGTTQLIEFWL